MSMSTCPRGIFLGLTFDNTTCPSQSTLLACPRQSSFSCCNSNHDKSIRTSYSRCILHSTSPTCCAALKDMQCIACNGEAAISDSISSGCFSDCIDLINSCENDFFVSEHGKLRPCQPDEDIICSRLSDILSISGNSEERITSSRSACTQIMGFTFSTVDELYEENEGRCVSVLSNPHKGSYSSPKGCKSANTLIFKHDNDRGQNFFLYDIMQNITKNSQLVTASITTIVLIFVILWVFIRKYRKKEYKDQGSDYKNYEDVYDTSQSQSTSASELPSLDELRALRMRRYDDQTTNSSENKNT